jgi:hypothetical protein
MAGLFEGEGYFGIRRNKGSYSTRTTIAMTDFDVIEDLQKLLREELGIEANTCEQNHNHPRWKKQLYLSISKKEDVSKLGLALLPYMGERRSEAIAKQLEINQLRNELGYGGQRPIGGPGYGGRPCRSSCKCSRHNRQRAADGKLLAGV